MKKEKDLFNPAFKNLHLKIKSAQKPPKESEKRRSETVDEQDNE